MKCDDKRENNLKIAEMVFEYDLSKYHMQCLDYKEIDSILDELKVRENIIPRRRDANKVRSLTDYIQRSAEGQYGETKFDMDKDSHPHKFCLKKNLTK